MKSFTFNHNPIFTEHILLPAGCNTLTDVGWVLTWKPYILFKIKFHIQSKVWKNKYFYIVDNPIEINEKPTAIVEPMINQNDHDTDDDNDVNNNNNIEQRINVLMQTTDIIDQLINNLTQQQAHLYE